MGVSTDAIIAFGFDLGEELPEAWRDTEYFDFEELQATEAGILEPEEAYSEATKDVYHAYWDAKTKAAKAHPADLIRHCSGDYPMYFLAANGTEQKAYRGSPERLDMGGLSSLVSPERIESLRAFCGRHGIEWQEPGWYLFSYWG